MLYILNGTSNFIFVFLYFVVIYAMESSFLSGLFLQKELRDLVNREHTRIDAETAATTGAEAAATPEKSAAKSPAAAKGISPKSSGKAPRTGSPKTKAENLGGSPGENKKGGKGSPKSTAGKL